MIVVGSITFISAADHGGAASADREGGKIPGQSGASCMISLICAQPQTDDHRPFKETHEGLRISDAQHNVIFLIGGDILRYQIKAAQVLFALFEFHHNDIRIRGGTGIRTALPHHTSGGNSGQNAAVAILIPGGNDGIRILGTQRPIDVLSVVFGTVF